MKPKAAQRIAIVPGRCGMNSLPVKMLVCHLRWIVVFMAVVGALPALADSHTDYVGEISKTQLFHDYPRFKESYEGYSFDEAAENLPGDFRVLVMFGTWCHDSEREVPRMLKLLGSLGVEEWAVTLIALDQAKREPRGRARALQVDFTPTFIFYVGGREVGRIVERPETTLEQDIRRLLRPQRTATIR